METLKSIITLIAESSKLDEDQIAQIYMFLKLSLGSLALMEGFVEDLLNLKLLKEGVFQIEEGVFSLTNTLDFVLAMFEIKAKSYNVKLWHSYCPELKPL